QRVLPGGSHGRCSSHENHLTLCQHPPHLGGTSAGHAWWTGRQATADYYDELIRQGATQPWSPGQLAQAREQPPVTEQYTLDLWFLRACEPEDDEEL
ncbi:hypothetical protein P1P70_45520, partial [Streptomyces sp. MB09-02B]|nr:hypothetical protein [Streptomyces sp. MB09-02B]